MPAPKAHLSMDDHELAVLEADLRGAPGRVQRGITKVIRRGAKLIDEQMTIDATGHVGSWFTPRNRHKGPTHLERYVSHEMLSPYEAEIGIENKGAGKLGALIAYGSPLNPGGSYDAGAGPRRAMPAIIDMAAEMGEQSVLGNSTRNRGDA